MIYQLCCVTCVLWFALTPGANSSPTNLDVSKRFLAFQDCSLSSLPNAHHGSYQCNSTRPTTGERCTLKCNQGYAPPPGHETIGCISHNRWTDESDCEEIRCYGPPKPAHGSYSCRTSSRYHADAHCTLTCDHGYLTANKQSSERLICLSNGTWSGDAVCEDPYCHNLPTVTNGIYVCSPGNHTVGSTCHLYCSKGHRVVGNDTISCNSSRQWSSPASCVEVQCPKPPELQDGVYNCPPGPYTHGTTCQLQCAVGHRPVTAITNITCRTDETWSAATTCTVGCSHGSYIKLDPIGGQSCETCAVGTYQSNPDSPSCEPCPGGWTTYSTGSKSVDSCLSICHPGTFSPNGLEPCHLCHLGSYQNLTGGQICHPCPTGQTTAHIGSTTLSDCVDV